METTSTTKTLAQAIRKRRKALGLTQEDLARLAECGSVLVNQIEAGKATARLDKLLNIMTVLGLEFVIRSGSRGITEQDGG